MFEWKQSYCRAPLTLMDAWSEMRPPFNQSNHVLSFLQSNLWFYLANNNLHVVCWFRTMFNYLMTHFMSAFFTLSLFSFKIIEIDLERFFSFSRLKLFCKQTLFGIFECIEILSTDNTSHNKHILWSHQWNKRCTFYIQQKCSAKLIETKFLFGMVQQGTLPYLI